jgi:hypothetical protein
MSTLSHESSLSISVGLVLGCSELNGSAIQFLMMLLGIELLNILEMQQGVESIRSNWEVPHVVSETALHSGSTV